jgi:hypothetical protein
MFKGRKEPDEGAGLQVTEPSGEKDMTKSAMAYAAILCVYPLPSKCFSETKG